MHKIGQVSASRDSRDGYIFDYNYDIGNQVFSDYSNMKDEVKAIISNKEFLADRHKIAAFFLSAILKNCPIQLKENANDTNSSDIEFLANINLGVVFASYCISEISGLGCTVKLMSPSTNGKKGYNDQFYGLIKLVKEHIDQRDSQKVLLMMISHIFFLLEEYSKISDLLEKCPQGSRKNSS